MRCDYVGRDLVVEGPCQILKEGEGLIKLGERVYIRSRVDRHEE